jgi:hypothetical protein
MKFCGIDEREQLQFDVQTASNKTYSLSAENEEDFKTWTTGLSVMFSFSFNFAINVVLAASERLYCRNTGLDALLSRRMGRCT